MDEEAQAEAYTRKKPRRIIQNQGLIAFLMCLVVVGALPFGGFIFFLMFGIYPSFIIPFTLVLWAVSSVSYIVMRLHVERQNKK